MRRETGRDETNGRALVRLGDGTELLQLVLHIQPVTALGLGGRRAVTRHRARSLEHVLNEALLRRGASGTNSGSDAAARRGDLFVRFALQAAIELRFAEAGPRQMGVRVDEAWNCGCSAGVEVFGDGDACPPLRTDVGDAAVAHDDHRVVVNLDVAHRRSARAGAPSRCGDLGEVADQQRHGRYSLLRCMDVIGSSFASCSASSIRSC